LSGALFIIAPDFDKQIRDQLSIQVAPHSGIINAQYAEGSLLCVIGDGDGWIDFIIRWMGVIASALAGIDVLRVKTRCVSVNSDRAEQTY
jgi:hypothetical protein